MASTAKGSAALAESIGGESKFADLGEGVRLHFVEMGEPTAPLVVLVHGFPEFWYCWRNQIPALVEAGYRVVAVDMRGYNMSSKPETVEAYAIKELASDIQGIIEYCGVKSAAAVIGHDWGAAVVWEFGHTYPEWYERLGILNVPHPAEFTKGLRTVQQLRKSWYIAAFQIPGVPEALVEANDWWLLRRVFTLDPDTPYSEADIEQYVGAFRDHPGALTSAINYYRSAGRQLASSLVSGSDVSYAELAHVIDKPVLVLWGERDAYLGKELATPPTEWVPNARTVFFPEATHWINHDVPDKVNAELIEFIGEPLSSADDVATPLVKDRSDVSAAQVL